MTLNPAKILVVGSLNMDYVLNTERLPEKGETLAAREFLKVHGGKGVNQSVAIKRLGEKGVAPVMVGCLGKDPDGEELIEALKNESIPGDFIQRSDELKTGIAFITVSDDGDNTIVVHPGSNHGLTVDWVQSAIDTHLDAKMLVLQMEIPLDVIISTIERAYDYGIPVVLNPSPFKALPKETLQKVHTLVVNEVEAMQIVKSIGDYDALDPKNLVALLEKSGFPQVILTLGDQGVYYNGDSKEDDGTIHHQAARVVQVVDPTAAGDSFLGAYVAGCCRGYSLNQAVSYGILAGALAVTKAGAQPSIPAAKDLNTAGWTE